MKLDWHDWLGIDAEAPLERLARIDAGAGSGWPPEAAEALESLRGCGIESSRTAADTVRLRLAFEGEPRVVHGEVVRDGDGWLLHAPGAVVVSSPCGPIAIAFDAGTLEAVRARPGPSALSRFTDELAAAFRKPYADPSVKLPPLDELLGWPLHPTLGWLRTTYASARDALSTAVALGAVARFARPWSFDSLRRRDEKRRTLPFDRAEKEGADASWARMMTAFGPRFASAGLVSAVSPSALLSSGKYFLFSGMYFLRHATVRAGDRPSSPTGELLLAGMTPVARVREFLAGLDAALRSSWLELLQTSTYGALDRLDELRDAVERELDAEAPTEDRLESLVHAARLERDRLENLLVTAYLASSKRGRHLRELARPVDEPWSLHATMLVDLPLPRDVAVEPALRLTAIDNPDAWWGWGLDPVRFAGKQRFSAPVIALDTARRKSSRLHRALFEVQAAARAGEPLVIRYALHGPEGPTGLEAQLEMDEEDFVRLVVDVGDRCRPQLAVVLGVAQTLDRSLEGRGFARFDPDELDPDAPYDLCIKTEDDLWLVGEPRDEPP
ncbi:MAG: hypothetical protein RMK74_04530 [Myxococcales bacterium]|nr:hypothetical protein [Myxococcales bacterium]